MKYETENFKQVRYATNCYSRFYTGDQKISREEWGILVAVSQNVREIHYLNNFRAADRNHDGFIAAEELQQRFRSLGHGLGLSIFQRIIERKDRNGDKKLGYYGKSQTEATNLFL